MYADVFEGLHSIFRVHELAIAQQSLQNTCLPCNCCIVDGRPPLQLVYQEGLCSTVQQEVDTGDMPTKCEGLKGILIYILTMSH